MRFVYNDEHFDIYGNEHELMPVAGAWYIPEPTFGQRRTKKMLVEGDKYTESYDDGTVKKYTFNGQSWVEDDEDS